MNHEKRKFLGYSMTFHREPRLRVAPASIERLKNKLRALFRQGRGRNLNTRAMNLMKRGIDENRAWMSAKNQRGAWWNSGASHMNEAFPKRFFDSIGLVSLLGQLHRIQRGS